MSAFQPSPPEIADRVPVDAAGAREIGFDVPRAYNASRLLFDNLSRGHAGRPAICAPEATFSYADVCAGAAQFGHGLRALGLRRGERVLLLLPDSPYAVAAFFGAIRAGLVPVLLDPTATPATIRHAAADSDALAAIADASVLPRLTEAATAGTRLSALVVVDGQPSGREPLPAVPALPWLGEFPAQLDAAATDRDDMAFWIYAAGRSGQPKAVVHLQHDLAYAAACHTRSLLGLSSGDRCLSTSPLFTADGLCATLAFPFAVGASSVARPLPAATGEPLADIHGFKPTVLFGAPNFYANVLDTSGDPRAALRGIRACIATSPFEGAGWQQAWQQRFGHNIIEGLTSPETLCPYISGTLNVLKPGTLGRRVPGFELILTAADGRPVADGEEGLLWVRGHSSAPCYWNRPEETAETMGADGWLFTGERLVRDVYGFYARAR
jgi:acyl-CoA synthetase (AMP-forming)/AMP-acid ligase II